MPPNYYHSFTALIFAYQSTISSPPVLVEHFCNGKYENICIVKIFSWILISPMLSMLFRASLIERFAKSVLNLVHGYKNTSTWWRHQMETFSALLAICAGNSPVSGEFPAQRPVTRSFDIFFDVRLIKRLSKHSRGWWFETLSHPLWRHRNDIKPWDINCSYML